jgi:hypothetical protein
MVFFQRKFLRGSAIETIPRLFGAPLLRMTTNREARFRGLFCFYKYLKKLDIFSGRGRVEIKSAAYMSICEHFYLRSDAEIGKKSDF